MEDKLLKMIKEFRPGTYTYDEGKFEIKHTLIVNGKEIDLGTLGEWELEEYLYEPKVLIDETNLGKMVDTLNRISKVNEIYFSFDSCPEEKFDKTLNNVWTTADYTYYTDLEFRAENNQIIAEFKFYEDGFNAEKTVNIPIPTYLKLLG